MDHERDVGDLHGEVRGNAYTSATSTARWAHNELDVGDLHGEVQGPRAQIGDLHIEVDP